MGLQSKYNATYTSFSGADIVATFDGDVIGELQAISYSVTREKAPIYTMGSPDPRSFSRGKRGIAGSLVFTVFNKDSLTDLKKKYDFHTAYANEEFRDALMNSDSEFSLDAEDGAMDEWNRVQNEQNEFIGTTPHYADEIPPFDITITLVNEYGQAAKFSLLGVEILNEGSGMSIDDITTEKACTFVARGITPLQTVKATAQDVARKSN